MTFNSAIREILKNSISGFLVLEIRIAIYIYTYNTIRLEKIFHE
jgi:hypothetical protein